MDFMYAYEHATSDDERIKLTGYSSGDKFFASMRHFKGFKVVQRFFTQQMSFFFGNLIRLGSAPIYIDNIFLTPNSFNNFMILLKNKNYSWHLKNSFSCFSL